MKMYTQQTVTLPVTLDGETRQIKFTHFGTGVAVSPRTAKDMRGRNCTLLAYLREGNWEVSKLNGSVPINAWIRPARQAKPVEVRSGETVRPSVEQLALLRDAISEAYHYGSRDGKRSASAEKRIASGIARATNWDKKIVEELLTGVY